MQDKEDRYFRGVLAENLPKWEPHWCFVSMRSLQRTLELLGASDGQAAEGSSDMDGVPWVLLEESDSHRRHHIWTEQSLSCHACRIDMRVLMDSTLREQNENNGD